MDDLKHGDGSMTWGDGATYTGGWRKDKKHESGAMLYK